MRPRSMTITRSARRNMLGRCATKKVVRPAIAASIASTISYSVPGSTDGVATARHKAHQRAFYGAGRADDRDALAGPGLEVDVLQDRVAPVVEPDFFKSHAALDARRAHGVARGFDLHRRVEHLEYAAGGAQ